MFRRIPTRWRRRLAVGATVTIAALAGAGALASQREADRPAEDAPPPPPPEALAQTTRDLDLPVSTSITGEPAPGAVSVLVTRGQLLVGGDPSPIAVFPEGLAALAATGLPARFKRDRDFFVRELGNELAYFFEQGQALGKPPVFAMLADARTPYRVMSEVLFTADSARFERVVLAVVRGTSAGPSARLAWLDVTLHDPRAIEVSRGPAPYLAVTADGFSIRWGHGETAPGCDPKAAGTLVPMAGGAYDHRALAECMRRVKSEGRFMQDETRLALHVAPAVDWQTLVTVIDAVRGADEARPLFPEVSLAVGLNAEVEPAWNRGEVKSASRPSGASTTGNARPGSASIGGAAVSGGAVANVSAVVAGMAAGFRRCYNKGLQEDRNMKGSVRITAKIGPNGEVVSVSPSGSGLSGTVIACVAARVSSAQFAPPEGGGATVVIPVTFVPQ